MAKVRLLQGKPLLIGGKVATSDSCCCGATCPDVEALTVEFSGIVMDCGCLPRSPLGPLFEPIIVTDYSAINGSFVVTRNLALPFFWTGDGGSYNYDAYTDDGCEMFDFSDIQTVGINVICKDDGSLEVLYSLGSPSVFLSVTAGLGTPSPNVLSCNDLIPDGTYPDFPFPIYGIARSGTVTITS